MRHETKWRYFSVFKSICHTQKPAFRVREETKHNKTFIPLRFHSENQHHFNSNMSHASYFYNYHVVLFAFSWALSG